MAQNRSTYEIFGERLKELRIQKGLSQQQLANMVHMSRRTIALYEKAMVKPRLKNVERLINFFGVSSDYMLGLSHERHISPGVAELIQECKELSEEQQGIILAILKVMKHLNNGNADPNKIAILAPRWIRHQIYRMLGL